MAKAREEVLYRVYRGEPAESCVGDNHGPFYQERGNVICAKCTWTFAPLVQVFDEEADPNEGESLPFRIRSH